MKNKTFKLVAYYHLNYYGWKRKPEIIASKLELNDAYNKYADLFVLFPRYSGPYHYEIEEDDEK